LWNPAGFPDIFYDEGVYMRRAMHILEGLGPQEGTFYDHPYFGQLFLAGVLGAIGYPESIGPSPNAESVQELYAVPRIVMGLLAVADTFLLFKITEARYGRRVAIVASVLFAVMPISWITRRILLDSILLPFLLTSILFAIYARSENPGRASLMIAVSGVSLGIAVFTKVPMVMMIPLVGYLIYSSGRDKARNIGLWLIPVILIPLIWPAYASSQGQFDFWIRDVIWQTQRQSAGFASMISSFFLSDPASFVLGFSGLIFAVIRRDVFLMLWLLPFIGFLSVIGYVQYFYWMPLLPALFVAAGLAIEKLAVRKVNLPYMLLACVATIGLVSTMTFITIDVTSAQFRAAAFVVNYAKDDITIASSPAYSWILIYVFEVDHTFLDYRDLLFYPVETERLVLVSDRHLETNLDAGHQIREAHEESRVIAKFEGEVSKYDTRIYPFTNLGWNFEGSAIEIKERK
jgi:hypothetical protein